MREDVHNQFVNRLLTSVAQLSHPELFKTMSSTEKPDRHLVKMDNGRRCCQRKRLLSFQCNAFAEAFSVERNERSWEIVGAAPFAVKCLELDKVRINQSDPNFSECERIEAANHNATSVLTAKGFNGELMKVVSN